MITAPRGKKPQDKKHTAQKAQLQSKFQFEKKSSEDQAAAAEASAAQPKRTRGSSFKFLKLLCSAALVLVIAIGSAFYLQLKALNDYAVPPRAEPFALEAGMHARDVITTLAGDKFNQAVIWAYVKLNADKLAHIQKGKYAVDGTLSVREILRRMTLGEIMQVKPFTVALVEGMNTALVQKRLQQADDLIYDAEYCFTKTESFMEDTLTKEQLEFLGGAKDTLEGLLLPATYPYFKDDSAKAVVQRSLRAMIIFLMEEWPLRSDKQMLKDPYEALILASIVERESSLRSEQPLIAGVFFNRLKKGMKLQTDPAVMYGVEPGFRGPLKRSQLEKDTPYNTYTRIGLPPTPIAMPGKDAVQAVLHPSSTKALYFVAKGPDPQDGHNFAETLRQHNRNVVEYRKNVREYKKQQL